MPHLRKGTLAAWWGSKSFA